MPILNYDVTEDYTNEYELIPDGEYLVTIVPDAQEIKETKSGSMLVMTYALENGRTIKDNHNFVNANATAMSIARANIQSIFVACGVPKNPNTDVLGGKRMVITIGHDLGKPYTDRNGVDRPAKNQNTISKYRAVGSATTLSAPQKETATSAQEKKVNPFSKK